MRFEVSDDGRTLEGRRVDLDPRELRRLRRREHAVDGRLDLHGMTADEARTALEAFVQKRRAEGDRVIVVVHGKGKHSPRGISVLRGEIGAWISQGRAARDVAAFTSIVDGDASSALARARARCSCSWRAERNGLIASHASGSTPRPRPFSESMSPKGVPIMIDK